MRSHTRHLGPPHIGGGAEVGYGETDDGQDYVDRSVIDFDPAEGLYSGTAATPGHEHHHTSSDDTPMSTASLAQRAADDDEAYDRTHADAFAVRRHLTVEAADIAAGAEISHDASL